MVRYVLDRFLSIREHAGTCPFSTETTDIRHPADGPKRSVTDREQRVEKEGPDDIQRFCALAAFNAWRSLRAARAAHRRDLLAAEARRGAGAAASSRFRQPGGVGSVSLASPGGSAGRHWHSGISATWREPCPRAYPGWTGGLLRAGGCLCRCGLCDPHVCISAGAIRRGEASGAGLEPRLAGGQMEARLPGVRGAHGAAGLCRADTG